jgi:katanin p60 ATPase-containing subunit A1
LDEVDALCGKRGAEGEHEASRRFKAELLVQIDACAAAAAAAAGATSAAAASNSANAATQAPRHVLVLAATNHPWDLDEALRRRLEKRVYVGLPDVEERRELLGLCLKGVESALTPADLRDLAKRLEGYSGDDVTAVCREAALEGVRRTVAGKSPAEVRAMAMVAAGGGGAGGGASAASAGAGPVTARDFEAAIARVRPSVSGGDAARHEAWSKEFGSA